MTRRLNQQPGSSAEKLGWVASSFAAIGISLGAPNQAEAKPDANIEVTAEPTQVDTGESTPTEATGSEATPETSVESPMFCKTVSECDEYEQFFVNRVHMGSMNWADGLSKSVDNAAGKARKKERGKVKEALEELPDGGKTQMSLGGREALTEQAYDTFLMDENCQIEGQDALGFDVVAPGCDEHANAIAPGIRAAIDAYATSPDVDPAAVANADFAYKAAMGGLVDEDGAERDVATGPIKLDLLYRSMYFVKDKSLWPVEDDRTCDANGCVTGVDTINKTGLQEAAEAFANDDDTFRNETFAQPGDDKKKAKGDIGKQATLFSPTDCEEGCYGTVVDATDEGRVIEDAEGNQFVSPYDAIGVTDYLTLGADTRNKGGNGNANGGKAPDARWTVYGTGGMDIGRAGGYRGLSLMGEARVGAKFSITNWLDAYGEMGTATVNADPDWNAGADADKKTGVTPQVRIDLLRYQKVLSPDNLQVRVTPIIRAGAGLEHRGLNSTAGLGVALQARRLYAHAMLTLGGGNTGKAFQVGADGFKM